MVNNVNDLTYRILLFDVCTYNTMYTLLMNLFEYIGVTIFDKLQMLLFDIYNTADILSINLFDCVVMK